MAATYQEALNALGQCATELERSSGAAARAAMSASGASKALHGCTHRAAQEAVGLIQGALGSMTQARGEASATVGAVRALEESIRS